MKELLQKLFSQPIMRALASLALACAGLMMPKSPYVLAGALAVLGTCALDLLVTGKPVLMRGETELERLLKLFKAGKLPVTRIRPCGPASLVGPDTMTLANVRTPPLIPKDYLVGEPTPSSPSSGGQARHPSGHPQARSPGARRD